jgi:uncharacterized membrane protein
MEQNNENKDKKETKIISMNSAMQNLKNMVAMNKTKTTTIESTEEKVKEEKIIKETPPADEVVNELAPKILEENVLSEEEDIKKTKKYAWLAYILFFIPLCINSKSPFVRLHATEGLDVFIIDIVATALILVGQLVKFSGIYSIIGMIATLVGIGIFILTTISKIFQIVQVCRGKKTQTPWLWKMRFIN